jgi:hypothetical protein
MSRTDRTDRKTTDFTALGELLPGLVHAVPALEPVGRVSPVKRRLIEAAEVLRQGTDIEEIGFQHSVLCQTSLPYRATSERRWEAQNGNVMLLVQAGEAYDPLRKQWVELPLPFGPKARLILMYLNSEAIRTQSPVIDAGDSMTAFLRQLQGREPNGDEIRKFKQQLAALARAKISLAAADLPDKRTGIAAAQQGDLPIVKFIELWFHKDSKQRVLWPDTLELTLDYFENLRTHAVPLNQKAIAALSHSAMALDVYAWLAQRLWRVSPAKPSKIAWARLHQQFGTGYKHIRQWRSVFLKTLKDVQSQYPAARLDSDSGGLLLRHSPPPVRSIPPLRQKLIEPTGSL